MQAFRHGDVILVRVDSSRPGEFMGKEESRKHVKRAEAHTLAEGEITGHTHTVKAETPLTVMDVATGALSHRDRLDLLGWLRSQAPGSVRGDGWRQDTTGTKLMIVPEGGATLTHQEHKQINLPAGQYIVYNQREHWEEAPEGEVRERRVYD